MSKIFTHYEWGSVAQYISYVEQVSGLEQVAGEDVYSFKVGKGGFAALYKKKRIMVRKLKENLAKLCIHVSRNKNNLDQGEIDVLIGLYQSIKRSIELCECHMERAAGLEANQEKFFFAPAGDEG